MNDNQTDHVPESFSVIFWRMMPGKVIIHTVWRGNIGNDTFFSRKMYLNAAETCGSGANIKE